MEVVIPQNCQNYLDKLQLNYSVSVKLENKKKKMITILIVSEKGIVELVVEEGTMKFAGRKVGTVESSEREPFSFFCIHTICLCPWHSFMWAPQTFVGFLLPLFTSKYMEVEVKH